MAVFNDELIRREGAAMPGNSKNLSFSTSKQALWKGHIQAQAKSGLTIKEYCRRHGLSRHTFGYWKKKLKCSIAGSKGEVMQIPAVPIARLHCGDVFGLRIWTRSGHIVEVRGEFSNSDVVELIKGLE